LGVGSSDAKAQAIAASSTAGYAIVGISSLSTALSGASGNRAAHIDSWNSNLGAYSSFPVNSNGNCSSNGNITLQSATIIKGSAQPGTGKSTSGGSVSGSTTPLNYAPNYPAPDPGTAVSTNDNASLPSTYFNSSTRDFTIPSGKTLTLGGGTYYVNNISWQDAHITFTGPAVFYITGGTFFTHNNYINTWQNKPANLKFEVTGACTVTYDFDQACYAVVYAPLATVTSMGMADDYGSIVGNNLTMTVGWHVDEALGGAGVMAAIVTVK
jgi:hypothetical protein